MTISMNDNNRPLLMSFCLLCPSRLGHTCLEFEHGSSVYTSNNSKWDYAPLFERQLLDVIQPDLCHAGEINECKKIAAMAEA